MWVLNVRADKRVLSQPTGAHSHLHRISTEEAPQPRAPCSQCAPNPFDVLLHGSDLVFCAVDCAPISIHLERRRARSNLGASARIPRTPTWKNDGEHSRASQLNARPTRRRGRARRAHGGRHCPARDRVPGSHSGDAACHRGCAVTLRGAAPRRAHRPEVRWSATLTAGASGLTKDR